MEWVKYSHYSIPYKNVILSSLEFMITPSVILQRQDWHTDILTPSVTLQRQEWHTDIYFIKIGFSL